MIISKERIFIYETYLKKKENNINISKIRKIDIKIGSAFGADD